MLDALHHVAMVDRHALFNAAAHMCRIDLDTAHLALAPCPQLGEQVAIATTEVQHPRSHRPGRPSAGNETLLDGCLLP